MLNVDKLIKKFKAIALDIFHYAGNTCIMIIKKLLFSINVAIINSVDFSSFYKVCQ